MQTAYNTDPAIARAGMLADSRLMKHTASRLASGPVKAGLGVFRVPGFGQPGTRTADPGQVYQNPSPGAALDVDAIVATGASAATPQVLTTADADGVVGAEDMFPARKLTVTCDAHTDWDATTGTISYVNHLGQTVTEDLALATSAALTTSGYARSFSGMTIPAQTGAGGAFTVGVAVLDASVTLADFEGVALYDSAKEPGVTTSGEEAEYADEETVQVLVRGAVVVATEDACSSGGAVYVRVTSGAGGSQLGAFRSEADTASAVLVTGARYARDSAAGALNQVEFY